MKRMVGWQLQRHRLRMDPNINIKSIENSVPRPPCQRASNAVILYTFDLRRVRLVVRTQPSQGWCTGSTPVRAAALRLRATTALH